MEGGTFRSSQYVDLLAQAYPPVEDEVLQQALEQPSPASGQPSPELHDINPMPAVVPDHPGTESISQQQPGQAPVESEETAAAPMDTGDNGSEPIDKSPAESVPEVPDVTSVQGSSGAASSSSSVVNSTYGPVRRRLPSKSGPLTLHRPLATQHDAFVEVMRDVLPHIMEQAVSTLKREAPDAESPPSSKAPRTTEQLSVECVNMSDLTASEAKECWDDLQSGTCHEVLIAQYLAKRMQKELPPRNNPAWLQAQVDSAKTTEWNTLADKQAVRLLSVAESNRVRKLQSHRIMGSRFVLTKKPLEDLVENGEKADPENPQHWKVKARWCLQGHLDPDLPSKARDGLLQSPTLSQMGRMVLFQLLASHSWLLQLGDIKGAFLEAGPMIGLCMQLYQ